MSSKESDPALPTDDDLVAYLDGELEPAEAQTIEARLSTDPRVRGRLTELERTWDLLETLPQGAPTDVFTRSTIELVLGDVGREKGIRRRRQRRRLFAAAGLVAVPLLLGTISFWLIRQAQFLPLAELERDLDVIRNVDTYTRIPGIGFLEQLDQSGLFAMEGAANANQE